MKTAERVSPVLLAAIVAALLIAAALLAAPARASAAAVAPLVVQSVDTSRYPEISLQVLVPAELSSASAPRFPTIRTVVVMDWAVGFVNTSTVRAKSSLPMPGTVISRCTYSPAIQAVGVIIVRSPSSTNSAGSAGANAWPVLSRSDARAFSLFGWPWQLGLPVAGGLFVAPYLTIRLRSQMAAAVFTAYAALNGVTMAMIFRSAMPFIGLQGRLRDVFLQAHGELLTGRWWRDVQERLRAGEIADIFPYRDEQRLHHAR